MEGELGKCITIKEFGYTLQFELLFFQIVNAVPPNFHLSPFDEQLLNDILQSHDGGYPDQKRQVGIVLSNGISEKGTCGLTFLQFHDK